VSSGDYHISNLIFQNYCDDKDYVGQFVFQREGLEDDFFREIPSGGVALRRVSGNLYLDNKKYLIDETKFKRHYSYLFSKRSLISKIGPIYEEKTSIIRKSDGKILGQAVSLVNKKGWYAETNLLWHNGGELCPIYRSKSGRNIGNSDHFTLIKNIFYKK
jgi:hypothetical protein